MQSPLETSVTLDDVLTVVTSKRVPLAPELAGYLVLAITDASASTDGDLDRSAVYISDEGTLAIVRAKKEPAATSDEVELSIRSVLLTLLEASGSQTPALGAVARKKAPAGLPGLAKELEVALIPANRSAGKRALARMSREVKRVTQGVGRNASSPPSSKPPSVPPPIVSSDAPKPELPRLIRPDSVPPPSSPPNPGEGILPKKKLFGGDEVDSLLSSFEVGAGGSDTAMSKDLKAMVGLEPTPPPPMAPFAVPPAHTDALPSSDLPPAVRRSSSPPPAPSGASDGVEDLLALAESSAPVSSQRSSQPPRVEAKRSSFPPQSAEEVKAVVTRQRVPFPSNAPPAPANPATRSLTPAGYAEPRAPKTGMLLMLLALVALVGAAYALFRLNPGVLSGRTAEQVAKERREYEQAVVDRDKTEAALRCHATVVVASAPAGSEVLLRVGQAPVDVERMPVGTRLEFVATAEGFAPKRTVVPAGAIWDKGADGKPRFEVAVQLDPSRSKTGADPWPPGEPGSEVGGKGAPGTVHVVATPKGAELWLLAGIGPEAKLEQLRCDADVEILVAGPLSKRTRLKASAKDVAAAAVDSSGAKLLTLSAK